LDEKRENTGIKKRATFMLPVEVQIEKNDLL
jgi:hypothetical protein